MQAFKCDICNKLFEFEEEKINRMTFYHYSSRRGVPHSNTIYDICPFCRDTLMDTIKDLRESDHN